jgi:hypothetical protein
MELNGIGFVRCRHEAPLLVWRLKELYMSDKVKVTLRPTVSRSWCQAIWDPRAIFLSP